jgi:hypothetical protein
MLQTDHTDFAGQLARNFGNSTFKSLDPMVIELVARHDEGWMEEDNRFLPDPDIGLPRHLGRGYKIAEIIETSRTSGNIHEAIHPFAGLISSMHSYGLYTGRYGIEDTPAIVDLLPDEDKRAVRDFLASELVRQERLRQELRSQPATMALADEDYIARIYKVLEFFDRFSLYVQCEHPSRHSEARFRLVPVDENADNDVTITVTPLEERRYKLAPYPFSSDPFQPATHGRYMAPQEDRNGLAAAWDAASPAEQRLTLVS